MVRENDYNQRVLLKLHIQKLSMEQDELANQIQVHCNEEKSWLLQ